ncbi:MAG TPA: (Fe-S)-binding protein [Polyangia bacterium]|jgi:Fe-S oxidoreductase|nr:(Fe-S)-binding protein [Polyangia bacterium]
MTPDLETSLSYCTYCPKLCRHTCPVSHAEARETLVPQAKMAMLRLLRRGDMETEADNAAVLYGCTGCLACTTACRHGITPGKHLLTARADMESAGAGHPALEDLPERVRETARRAAHAAREALGTRPAADRSAPSNGEAGERANGEREARVAFFPACDDPGLGVTALRLFERAGVTDAGLAEVSLGCGGYPLLAGGFPVAFRLHAEVVARELARYERVVMACPACVVTMREEYPRHGVALRPEVLHPAEFLDTLRERLPLPRAQKEDARGTAFYHDPCYLGRHSGVYEAPRRLLQAARMEVREFSRNQAEGECSGGGGVLPITAPATARAVAEHRLEEVREAGLETVVTACGTCKRQLGQSGVVVRDIIEILEEATRDA